MQQPKSSKKRSGDRYSNGLAGGYLPSDINKKRYFQPKISMEVNPHCEDRQLEDQRYLAELNRNPRLNQLTKAEASRSEKFMKHLRKEPSSATLDRKKAHILAKTMGVNIEEGWAALDRTRSQGPSLAASAQASLLGGGGGGGGPLRASHSAQLLPTAAAAAAAAEGGGRRRRRPGGGAAGCGGGGGDPTAMPELLPYRRTVLAATPPTYGHRPNSASRVVNPATLGLNAGPPPLKQEAAAAAAAAAAARRGAGGGRRGGRPRPRGPGMSAAELRELLFLSPGGGGGGGGVGGGRTAASPPEGVGWRPSTQQRNTVGGNNTDSFEQLYSTGGAGDDTFETFMEEALLNSLSRLDLKQDWNASTQLEKPPRPAPSLILEGSIPARTEGKLQRYRKKAAGNEPFPFCDDRQANDALARESVEGLTRPHPRGPPAPPTPRRARQAGEIRALLAAEAAREERRQARARRADLVETWSRIPQV